MTVMMGSLTLTIGCIPTLAAAGALHQVRGQDRGAALAVIVREAEQLSARIARLREEPDRSRRRIEEAREAGRERERRARHDRSSEDTRAWEKDWERTAWLRRAVAARLERLIEPWERHLTSVLGPAQELGAQERAQLSTPCLGVVTEWIRVGEPTSVLEALQPPRTLGALLAGVQDAELRRSFLDHVVQRLVATPGQSDVDVLALVVAWEALLLDRSEAPLQDLTADLMLLFTERSPDGFSRSGSSYYSAGRFQDHGFKESLRDGSNQVRHFCWAWRLFAISTDPAKTEQLLSWKELQDARRRREPVNAADLELNRLARDLVEELGGGSEGASAELPPLPIGEYPALLRRMLGG